MHRPAPKDESNPYFAFNPELCIVCSRCVRACDEVQGTFALTIQGRGFESKVSASQNQPFLESECVSCGACVESCPTAALTEKSIIGLGQAERAVTTTCAYCGVGCSFKAELKGEGADVEVVRMAPNRQGAREPRARLRQGPLRLWLRDAPRPRSQADDPQEHHGRLARSLLGRGDRLRRERDPPHPGKVRPRLGRRHHLLALHERGDVPRAEAGPRRVRHQQRRYLRARVPFADRLRPEEHARRVGRHPGVRLGHAVGRDHGHRCESDRRPPGVRVADEAPPAPGREADRRRPAPDRIGASPAYRRPTCTCS